MNLYDHPECPYGMKVRIVLAEGGLDYEMVNVDLQALHHHQPEFLKLNPFGKVPVLVDDDIVVYDSSIINEYLNDEYFPSEESLLPEDSGLRAKARMLEEYADVAFTLPAMAIERELAKSGDERDQHRLTTAQDVLRKGLSMLDRELGDQEYLVGSLGLADIAFAPTVLQLGKLGIKVESSMAKVKAWINRLAERPSVGTVVKMVA
jgi:glutathione S-transferase